MPRWWLTAVFGVLLCGLVLASTPRITGDGLEYLTLAQRFAHGQGPSLSSEDVRPAGFPTKPLPNGAGRFELWHFWVFPLLAAPFVACASALHMPAVAGFTIFNALLLLSACWSIERRLGPWAAAFLFFSPIVWWTDKAQVEVFTVALLAFAAATVDRLSICALFCAAASTQNPPLAVFAVAAAITTSLPRYHARRGPRWAWWAAGGLVLLHPLYYFVALGRATPLVSAADLVIPSPGLLLTPLVDLNVGIVWTAFFSSLAAAVAWLLAFRRSRAAALLAACAAFVLLLAFAQAPNVNSGGTPGVDRYALWLFPIAAPLVAASDASRLLRLLVIVSALSSPIAFRPSLPDSFLRPTALAMRVWTRHPGWENPPAEIFAERIRHEDGVNTLAATPGCEKVLVSAGEWPGTCAPAASMPSKCRTGMCYANRRPDGSYAFVTAARRPGWHMPLP